jgi:hypothetical protein
MTYAGTHSSQIASRFIEQSTLNERFFGIDDAMIGLHVIKNVMGVAPTIAAIIAISAAAYKLDSFLHKSERYERKKLKDELKKLVEQETIDRKKGDDDLKKDYISRIGVLETRIIDILKQCEQQTELLKETQENITLAQKEVQAVIPQIQTMKINQAEDSKLLRSKIIPWLEGIRNELTNIRLTHEIEQDIDKRDCKKELTELNIPTTDDYLTETQNERINKKTNQETIKPKTHKFSILQRLGIV